MRRFLPSADTPGAEEAYAEVGLAARAEQLARPYVIANMVATVDGRAALDGGTRDISSKADRILFHALRDQVDAVMAGTGTIGLERYGPLVKEDERRQRRVARGLAERPLAVTASRSLELPVDVPLFADPESRIVVLAGAEGDAPQAGADISIVRVPGPDERTLDLVTGLERLRRDYGVRTLLLEGGPTLLAAMLEVGLVDELFLAIAPLLVGGGPEPSILEGPPLPEPVALRLLGLLEEEGFLFLRYAVGA